MYDDQKAKGLFIKLKYQKFQASNVLMYMKPNEKLQSLSYQAL